MCKNTINTKVKAAAVSVCVSGVIFSPDWNINIRVADMLDLQETSAQTSTEIKKTKAVSQTTSCLLYSKCLVIRRILTVWDLHLFSFN